MPIRAVIFDVGGVLLHIEDWSHHQRWEQRLGLSEGELLKRVFGSEVAMHATLGQAQVAEVWEYIATTFGLNAEEARQLKHDFFGNELLNTPLLMFLRDLRPRYKTAILSNAWSDAREVFCGKHGMADVVDEVIISAEEGLAKPDARIYQLAAKRLGVQPAEANFVDDFPANVEAASAIGIHAILFKDNEQVISQIQQILATA